MQVGEANNANNAICRSAIKFLGLSAIPSTAIVTSASLVLYHQGGNASNTRTMHAYRLLKNWDLYGCSWNNYNGTNLWTVAGGSSVSDCEQTDIGNISLLAKEPVGFKTINLTPSKVQDWISGSIANYGVLLKMDTELNDRHTFTASDGAIGVNRPKLIVNYTVSGTPYAMTIQQI